MTLEEICDEIGIDGQSDPFNAILDYFEDLEEEIEGQEVIVEKIASFVKDTQGHFHFQLFEKEPMKELVEVLGNLLQLAMANSKSVEVEKNVKEPDSSVPTPMQMKLLMDEYECQISDLQAEIEKKPTEAELKSLKDINLEEKSLLDEYELQIDELKKDLEELEKKEQKNGEVEELEKELELMASKEEQLEKQLKELKIEKEADELIIKSFNEPDEKKKKSVAIVGMGVGVVFLIAAGLHFYFNILGK